MLFRSPNYGKRGYGPLMKRGLCIAIEPMITLGAVSYTHLRGEVFGKKELAPNFTQSKESGRGNNSGNNGCLLYTSTVHLLILDSNTVRNLI